MDRLKTTCIIVKYFRTQEYSNYCEPYQKIMETTICGLFSVDVKV